jgi:adenosylcobinamide-phosphate synthase
VAGLVTAASAPLVGGSPRSAWAAVRRDAGRHPSPNAGVVEAAFAGALNVRLGGRNVYHGRAEDRGVLGDGRAVRPSDLPRSNRLAAAVSVVSLGLAMIIRGTRR